MRSARPAFFTGGTALREFARHCAKAHFAAAHLVTTFDSGGSSAALRKAFAIPAVGDLRNRLLALADPAVLPANVASFFNSRLPVNQDSATARAQLAGICHDEMLFGALAPQFAQIFRHTLAFFSRHMPPGFDARGASLGNIILAASYLENGRDFAPVLSLFSSLFHVCGVIAPIVNASLHLGAVLENGSVCIGQHLFKNLPCAVRELFLTVHESPTGIRKAGEIDSCAPRLGEVAHDYLAAANLICYPMGSFYSSVLATLLPVGIGRAIAANPAPKIFIPNSGHDPELAGLNVAGQAMRIVETLHKDAPEARPGDFLNYVLLDETWGQYPGGLDGIGQELAALGIKLVKRPLGLCANPCRHEPEALLGALVELLEHGRAD